MIYPQTYKFSRIGLFFADSPSHVSWRIGLAFADHFVRISKVSHFSYPVRPCDRIQCRRYRWSLSMLQTLISDLKNPSKLFQSFFLSDILHCKPGACKFTRGVIADCLQLQVVLCGIADIFACDCAGIFFCVCSYFCLRLVGIFTFDSSIFACKLHVFLPAKAGNFAC